MRVSAMKAVGGLLVGLLLVTVVTPVGARSRTNDEGEKWKLTLDCFVQSSVVYYPTVPIDQPGFERSIQSFQAEEWKTLGVGKVWHYDDPTDTERTAVEKKIESCKNWLDKVQHRVHEAFCEKWNSLEPWQLVLVPTNQLPLRRYASFNELTKPEGYKNWGDSPGNFGWYGKNMTQREQVAFDPTVDCK